MNIHHTARYFIDHYQPSISFLESYYENFPESFHTYFLYHCAHKQKKMIHAINKYPSVMQRIEENSDKMESHILHIITAYEKCYQVKIDIQIHLIVGVFSSNAFANRKVIPDLTFCLEQISSHDTHVKVIIAHEFGHVIHGIISEQVGVNWSNIDWTHPYTMLLQEGSATYFSSQVVEADPAVYFTYHDDGRKWYHFAQENKKVIMEQFMKDINKRTREEVYKEWFSINGGSHYGYTRLAYFIGFNLVETLLKIYPVEEAVTIWKNDNYLTVVERILKEMS